MTWKDSSKPRVLLIAEAANPEWVSVPLVGWSNARAIAQVTDAHLVTQIRNREAILRAGLVEGTDFTAIDSETVSAPLSRLSGWLRGGANKGWTTVQAFSAFSNYYFEQLVWRQFRRQITAGEFQIVHRLTPLSPTIPSLLAGRCRRAGVPFILGPLNGGLPWPRPFDRARRQEKEWLSYIRSVYKLMPGYHSTRRDAAAILIGSAATWEQIPRRYRSRCFYIAENGIAPERFTRGRNPATPRRPIRAVFVGRLVPYKGADMLIEAAAPFIRAGELTLDLIGDGPQMPALRVLAERERLGDGLTFHGWVEHQRLAERLLEFDLFTFPSIREFGGAVVLEAMAMGLVPVVVAYGGPAEIASAKTGFLIEMGDRGQIIERMRSLFARLVADPSPIPVRARAAIRRARSHFTWSRKAEQILEVYRWVLGQRPDKPSFPMPLPDEDEIPVGEIDASEANTDSTTRSF